MKKFLFLSLCFPLFLFAQSAKPNVIYILADDLGYGELGCYGQSKIKTPNIDALAKNGMRFTRHYSGAPVCAPSRGVLLTGKQLSKAYVRNNREYKPEGQEAIPNPGISLAQIFKDQAYATGAFGKWGLGYPGSSSDPKALGFDRFYGYNCQRVAHSFYPPHLWSDDTKVIINKNPVPGHWRKPVGSDFDFSQFYAENYAPDLILDEALKFITTNKDKPFFAYLPFIEPHLAMHPPHNWVDSYPKEWDLPKKNTYKANYLPHLRPRAGYAAMISDLDEHVGAVMSLLKELNLENNTLVIFSSDNGASHCIEVDHKFFNSVKGLRGLKGSVYEGGLRVPMIAHWPGKIKTEQVSQHVSGFVDVLATMCELLDTEVPETNDGVSFLAELLGKEQETQPVLAWEFQGYGGQQAIILDGRWKGVRQNLLPRGKKKKSTAKWELYDLENDPQEQNDLATQMPEVVDRVHKAMMKNRSNSEKFHMPMATQ